MEAAKKERGANPAAYDAWNVKVREAPEALAKAEAVENAAYDLKAVNLNRVTVEDRRTVEELLAEIEIRGRDADAALAQLRDAISPASLLEAKGSGLR